MPDTTQDLLRARFNEVKDQRDALQAAIQPTRDVINAKYAEIAVIQAEIDAEAVTLQAAMPELQAVEEELSRLALALGGRRMSDAA